MDNNILLVGGGGHCKAVIDVIEQEKKFQIAGIIDRPELVGSKVLNYEIIGSDDDLPQLSQTFKYALITIGQIKSPNLRIKLFEAAKKAGFVLPAIISPRAYISKYATVDEGSVVMHDAVINSNANIGKNCIINTKALIEHDSSIEAHCHISTGVIVNGDVTVEKNCFIGSGATIKEAIIIKEDSFIKMGSIVK